MGRSGVAGAGPGRVWTVRRTLPAQPRRNEERPEACGVDPLARGESKRAAAEEPVFVKASAVRRGAAPREEGDGRPPGALWSDNGRSRDTGRGGIYCGMF